jgi:hypothetical protein
MEVRPIGPDQRLTSVRKNQKEIQSVLSVDMAKHVQRPSFKRMVAAGDRYTLRVVPEMGSLRWFPSTE